VLGLVLAAVGIYGVISYSVTRQKHEIGMRMTLGVTESRVQFDVVAKALGLAVIGIALGTAGSLAPTKWIASLLFNMEPNDPLTFSGIIVLLAMGALVAGYIPARRASRIDPMIVLRAN
jgi:ABC-type antimicrobial peptide transport system permease subunit